MKTCLFCQNTTIYNIHNYHKNNGHTIDHTAKEVLLIFFGYQIEEHLRPDDAICDMCLNIMDSAAKLKTLLLPFIFRTDSSYVEEKKPQNIGKKWVLFASSNYEEEEQFYESSSPTSDNLLTCKMVVPYESSNEKIFAEEERIRSQSRISFKPSVDDEIVELCSEKKPRKRKRGHNWTRRKNGRSSRASNYANSVYSGRTRSRPNSAISTASSAHLDKSSPKNNLRYDENGCLLNKKTRAVSRLQEEIFNVIELHLCSEPGCGFISTKDGLDAHKLLHSADFICVVCHEEFNSEPELLKHWQKHLKSSVTCRTCGKKFLNRQVLEKHKNREHKKRPIRRIDFNKNIEASSTQINEFQVKYLINEDDSLRES